MAEPLKLLAATKELSFNNERGLTEDQGLIVKVHQNLFIVQAEDAGSTLNITEDKVAGIEKIVDEIEKILPPIKNFFISGATELGATFDFARTLARRAERRVVATHEEGK